MRPIRVLLVVILLLVTQFACAQRTSEWREVVTPRTRVLFSEPQLASYALETAARAEAALDVLTGLFGSVPPLTTIRLDGDTDLYNAIAPPLPRPRVVMPALFPAVVQVDPATSDPLYALLLHELTHVAQLSYLERPPGVAALPRLGLVGEVVAPLPPGWLLEGLAVWVAATRAPGGAVVDARTRGVLHALALEGHWPSLEDVSLLSHSDWPAGEARYLLGGAFVGYLVERYGWDTLLASLREANAGWYLLPFETAWRRASGDTLETAWRDWSESVEERAVARAGDDRQVPGSQLTHGGRASIVLAVDPTGERIAWRPAGGGLVISDLRERPDGHLRLGPATMVLPPYSSPISVDWPAPDRIVYSRLAPGDDDRFFELFELDLSRGQERRLSSGARARFVSSGPEGCLYYVRDVVSERSALMRLCRGDTPETVFRAPSGTHLVGLTVSDEGLIALSLWRAGQSDLALLDGDHLRLLTNDAAQDLDPIWRGEEEILFRSNRDGVFEIYSLRAGEGQIRRRSATVGGAFSPAVAGDSLLYSRLGGEGFDLAAASLLERLAHEPLVAQSPSTTFTLDTSYLVHEYQPWSSLAPFGWLPAARLVDLDPLAVAVSASVLGQDRSGDHAYSITTGYDPTLVGLLAGAWGNLRYEYRGSDAFDLFQRPAPWGFGVQLGLWPHAPHLGTMDETAAGLRVELWSRTRLGSWAGLSQLGVGALHLQSHGGVQADARLDLVASRRYADLWGYGESGPRLAAHLIWSASPVGGRAGAWIDASQVLPPGRAIPFTTTFAVRAGYRPVPSVPLDLADWAVFAGFGVRRSLPVELRYADGLVALERLTVEGRLHGAFDGNTYGAVDLSLWADTMLRYGAPVSLGGSFGYAAGWWYRVGVRLPL